MKPVTSRIEIARPPEDVFAFATDPASFPRWQDDVLTAHLEGEGPAAVGSSFVTVRRMGPSARPMRQQITVNEPPRRWAARGLDGPVRADAELVVEPLGGGTGSRVTVTMTFRARGAGRLLVDLVVRPLAARRAPESYRHLKELLERGA